ncbi:Hypothetical predicted protein [Paramuricea clavata]|uniref:Uncharacterized protein n=1 Tax=Paramuricea clavata TaxID=317549 RepID=A0A6S7K4U3_PARCT|nr:Hypothetical predicted protein [Paramuricea clavata]
MINLKRTTFKRRLGNYNERLTPLKFKYKANAKQFIYNAEVKDLVVSMVEHLAKENPNREQALEYAKKALVLIHKRQKLIKLANKSDAGWLVVEEYESDELADDSEDDKKSGRHKIKPPGRKSNCCKLRISDSERTLTSFPMARCEVASFFQGNCVQVACFLCNFK